MIVILCCAMLAASGGETAPTSAVVPQDSVAAIAGLPALVEENPGPVPGFASALDGMHYRGCQTGGIASLLDGYPTWSALAGESFLSAPAAAVEREAILAGGRAGGVFSGLSGATAIITSSPDSPGMSGEVDFGMGSMVTGDMTPLWHPFVPSHETRPLLEDCLTASAAVEGAAEGVLPGLTTVLVSGEFVTSEPADADEGSWRDNWDNNGYDRWNGLAKLGWIRSESFEAGITFALHERERGWSDWSWSRFEDLYIDTDTTSSTFGDTLAGGVGIDCSLPTRYDEGSLVGLDASFGLGQAGTLGASLAVTGSRVYTRIDDPAGGYLGEGFDEEEWGYYTPPALLLDSDGFVRSGVHDLLWFDSEDDALSAGLDWSLTSGRHSLTAGSGLMLHDISETCVTLLDSQTTVAWQEWAASPTEGFLAVRDAIDLNRDLAVTPGLRLGYFDPAFDFTEEPGIVMPGANTGGPLPGGSLSTEASAKTWLDMSLAIVQDLDTHHSVTVEYSRVSRMPRFVFLYPGTDSILVSEGQYVGNPDLDPEVCTDISLGLSRTCPGRGEMGVSVYYRTMDDLVRTELREDPAQGSYRQFDNGATATVQGLEVSHRAGLSDWLAWSATYTLSKAEGTWSVLQQPAGYEWVTPWISETDEFPLEWDRRHSLDLSLAGEFPGRFGALGGLGAELAWSYASGFPLDTSYYGEAPATRNSERYPDMTRLDASVWKEHRLGGLDLTLRLDVVNLSQERNIARVVDTEWYFAELGGDGDYDMDPTGPMGNSHAFASPRHFMLGLSIGW
ncbi:MAG: outer membrane beta-barrel protein [Candidatus Fermentibacter sp.]|nr:outer membrane beta-barrel protein [Candidatus Fermentibacter sp.]